MCAVSYIYPATSFLPSYMAYFQSPSSTPYGAPLSDRGNPTYFPPSPPTCTSFGFQSFILACCAQVLDLWQHLGRAPFLIVDRPSLDCRSCGTSISGNKEMADRTAILHTDDSLPGLLPAGGSHTPCLARKIGIRCAMGSWFFIFYCYLAVLGEIHATLSFF